MKKFLHFCFFCLFCYSWNTMKYFHPYKHWLYGNSQMAVAVLKYQLLTSALQNRSNTIYFFRLYSWNREWWRQNGMKSGNKKKGRGNELRQTQISTCIIRAIIRRRIITFCIAFITCAASFVFHSFLHFNEFHIIFISKFADRIFSSSFMFIEGKWKMENFKTTSDFVEGKCRTFDSIVKINTMRD